MSRRRRIAKGCGIGCGGLIALVVVTAAVLAIWKPWAPEIVVTDPSAGGTRITDQGLTGNYYPAAGGKRAPGVLVLGGSEGGIGVAADAIARQLSREGFSALALSYWGAPGQPKRMEELPLDTFDTALSWLRSQSTVNPDGTAVVGASKGGEAAVLLASRHPDVSATVGYVPTHVVWGGFDQAEPWRMVTGMGSTWSAGGAPVPYVPYSDGFRGGDLVELYRMSLRENLASHQDAIIPVERASGPMLLVCGEKDTMWASCEMSREIEKRARAKSGPEVTVLAYPEGGHMIAGPPIPSGVPPWEQLGAFGGTPDSNAAAMADGWPKVVAFLRQNLTP